MPHRFPFEDLFSCSTMSLATTSPDGQPYCAAVYFVAIHGNASESSTQWGLYFFSDPDSQHIRNLTIHNLAAACIYPESSAWRDIRGLQVQGLVRAVTDKPEWQQAWEGYCQKFPFVGQLKAVVARNTLYVFQVRWVRLVDNRLGLGYKREWDFDTAGPREPQE